MKKKNLKTNAKIVKSKIRIKEKLTQNDLEASNQNVSEERTRIIQEYKEQNKIETLTEEDLTNIFGIEALYPDSNKPMSEWFDHSRWTAGDWQDYYSNNNTSTSYNISISDEFDEIDLGDADQLSEDDEYIALFENEYLPFWLFDDVPQTSEAHFWKNYEKITKINRENEMIKELYDLGDADCLNEGEWERSLEEELEYKLSIRTKTVEVNVTDFSDFIHWLYRGMEETTYQLKIHWNTGGRKFLIKVSDEEQFYYYQVILESDSNNGKNSLYLGSDSWRSSVWAIIDYYLETGNSAEGN